MDDKTPCARCARPIDPYARICPYCSWDQTSTAAPPPQQQTGDGSGYVPPLERNWRRHALFIGGGILVLVASFFVGALINSDDTPKDATKPVSDEIGQQAGLASTRRSDVTLVPFNDSNAELPITSAPVSNPAEGVPIEYQRSDATAVSSVEYAALEQRARAEQKARRQAVDPRSLTGPAYAQAPPRPAPPAPPPVVPAPMTSGSPEPDSGQQAPVREGARVVERTRPVPQLQPLPNLVVSKPVTVRLELTVGADGRVKAVRIRNAIPGKTAQLIAAVQSWRFKPATENGVPVEAPFTVDISFNP